MVSVTLCWKTTWSFRPLFAASRGGRKCQVLLYPENGLQPFWLAAILACQPASSIDRMTRLGGSFVCRSTMAYAHRPSLLQYFVHMYIQFLFQVSYSIMNSNEPLRSRCQGIMVEIQNVLAQLQHHYRWIFSSCMDYEKWRIQDFVVQWNEKKKKKSWQVKRSAVALRRLKIIQFIRLYRIDCAALRLPIVPAAVWLARWDACATPHSVGVPYQVWPPPIPTCKKWKKEKK